MKRREFIKNSAILGTVVALGSALNLNAEQNLANSNQGKSMTKIKITIKDKEFTAVFSDNATTKEMIEKMPFEVQMQDLYERELCYRFGGGAFSVDETTSTGYEIGDIAYWPPRGSLVILYEQNGEKFERVHLGKIEQSVESLKNIGDVKVKFEVLR